MIIFGMLPLLVAVVRTAMSPHGLDLTEVLGRGELFLISAVIGGTAVGALVTEFLMRDYSRHPTAFKVFAILFGCMTLIALARGTYAVSQACIPHMVGRANPHILTLSPPVRLEPAWLTPTAYMMAKYGMSLCALAMAEELRTDGIASNTLWPRTLVATAAVQNLLGGDEAMGRARKPDVYADAAYVVLNKPSREYTGTSLLCEDVLLGIRRHRSVGLRLRARAELGVDLWVDTPNPPGYKA